MKRRRRKAESHWTRLGRTIIPLPMSNDEKKRLRNRVITAASLLLLLWLTFFDSHSLLKRLRWHNEYSDLSAENEQLLLEIERLEKEVASGLSDEVVEKIAREEYGMRRPGETVYRVRVAPDE